MVVSVLEGPHGTTIVEGRSLTRPLFIFIAAMGAVTANRIRAREREAAGHERRVDRRPAPACRTSRVDTPRNPFLSTLALDLRSQTVAAAFLLAGLSCVGSLGDRRRVRRIPRHRSDLRGSLDRRARRPVSLEHAGRRLLIVVILFVTDSTLHASRRPADPARAVPALVGLVIALWVRRSCRPPRSNSSNRTRSAARS